MKRKILSDFVRSGCYGIIGPCFQLNIKSYQKRTKFYASYFFCPILSRFDFDFYRLKFKLKKSNLKRVRIGQKNLKRKIWSDFDES
jgi:hypothetical protein